MRALAKRSMRGRSGMMCQTAGHWLCAFDGLRREKSCVRVLDKLSLGGSESYRDAALRHLAYIRLQARTVAQGSEKAL